MTQVCTELEVLRTAQEAVLRTGVTGAAEALERFYDAAAAYDESHGDDPVTPACRVCAGGLGVGEHWPHDEACATGGFCSCRDEVHPGCTLICIGCRLPVGDDAHWPHEADCGGIEDPQCRCDRPSCAECCTDPGCPVMTGRGHGEAQPATES